MPPKPKMALRVFFSNLVKSGFLNFHQITRFHGLVDETAVNVEKGVSNGAAMVKKFLNNCFARGLDVNSVNKKKENLLIWLCSTWDGSGLSDLVEFLISKKIDLKYVEPQTSTNALLGIVKNPKCCWSDAVKAAKHLIENGVDVNHKDIRGSTALWEVCSSAWHYEHSRNHAKVAYSLVRLLIEGGADVFYTPDARIAPNAFMLLLKAGGSSLRCHYPKEGGFLLKIAELFILEGIDVNATTSDGNNALTLLIKNFFRPPNAIDSRRKIAALFIESGTSLHAIDSSGRNLVNMLASIPQFLDEAKDAQELSSTIQFLISKGVDVNNTDIKGNNALLNLVMSVRKCAPVDDFRTSRAKERFPPLFPTRTVTKEPLILPVVNTLLRAGIDCNIRNRDGKDVRDLLLSRSDVFPRMTTSVLEYLDLLHPIPSANEHDEVAVVVSPEESEQTAGRGHKRKAEEEVIVVSEVKRPCFIPTRYLDPVRLSLSYYQNHLLRC